ncbi:major capsid protein [Capybara microvirus Cap1_SP_131]|nr:major capsid protein [Capybara microvirus Cap1_SP_131]
MSFDAEARFAQVPDIEHSRSIFKRSSGNMLTFNVGELVPVYLDEILPGDSVSIQTSKVVRLQTLERPLFSNLFLDTYWFFVPNRLCWSHWKEFCGENTESAWIPETTYTMPKIKTPAGGFAVGTIADYFGLPVNQEWDATHPRHPSSLPFRAYALICNEFFRDQNVSDPLHIPLDESTQQGSNGSNYIQDVANGGKPFIAAKTHDYFTSCLPSAQKGSAVNVPLPESFSGFAPVFARPINVPTDYHNTTTLNPLRTLQVNKNSVPKPDSTYDGLWYAYDGTYFGDYLRPYKFETASNDNYFVSPRNLWADIPTVSNGVNTLTINQLRLAFQTQRYLEQLARSGSRYIELIRGFFGVTSPDARLQRPEYLGGNRVPLNIHQIANTSATETAFLGDVGALSVTGDVHYDFDKSFTEHGFLIGLAVVRYDHIYSQGINRLWSRNTFTDYYLPVFANLGEQPVYSSEIYYQPGHEDDVFGFQEAWAEYRYKPSTTCGEMHVGINNSLALWHLGDYYTQQPTLSDSWIREDKAPVDRALSVTSQISNQIFSDWWFDATYTRCMPMFSVPGMIDHN